MSCSRVLLEADVVLTAARKREPVSTFYTSLLQVDRAKGFSMRHKGSFLLGRKEVLSVMLISGYSYFSLKFHSSFINNSAVYRPAACLLAVEMFNFTVASGHL